MVCSNCNCNIEENAKFCKSCGNKLIINDDTDNNSDTSKNNLNNFDNNIQQKIYCPKYGNCNDENTKFCNKCDFNLNEVCKRKINILKIIFLPVGLSFLIFIIPWFLNFFLQIIGFDYNKESLIFNLIAICQITLPILFILGGPFVVLILEISKNKSKKCEDCNQTTEGYYCKYCGSKL